MKRPTRRQVLQAGVAAAAAALGLDAALEARSLDVTRHDFPVSDLPLALDGFTIAHVSDLHLPCIAADRAADALAAAPPDIIVITGDSISYRRRLPLVTAWLERARSKSRVFAVRGNNERWGRVGLTSSSAAFAHGGATLLENTHASLAVGDTRLQIVGLDDPASGRPDVDAAFRGCDPTLPTIWMMHAPGYIDKIDRQRHKLPRALLVFAGHTHGGQIRGPGCTPVVPRGSGRFRAGFYESGLGPVYVTRGIGTSNVPLRFLCRPELPIFTLRRA